MRGSFCIYRRDDLRQVGDWTARPASAPSMEDEVARYFLHLHECGERFEDEEGFDCETPLIARAIALDAARDIMAAEVREGRLCLLCHIAIEDFQHHPVMTVSFGDALRISGQ